MIEANKGTINKEMVESYVQKYGRRILDSFASAVAETSSDDEVSAFEQYFILVNMASAVMAQTAVYIHKEMAADKYEHILTSILGACAGQIDKTEKANNVLAEKIVTFFNINNIVKL